MSGISSVSSSVWMPRPDPSQLASKLFSKLDTSNKGYLEQSDLQSAFNSIDGSSDSDAASALFSKLDGDGDGKVTQNEMSDGLKKLTEQLDQQFNSMRMQGGGRPPGPPPSGGMGGPGGAGGPNSAGFSKDELQSKVNEAGSSDDERTSLISSIVQNFDEVDSDGDGKVSFQEAMAYRSKQSESSETASDSSTGATASADGGERKMMMQLMKLIHAYGGASEGNAPQALSSLLSVEA